MISQDKRNLFEEYMASKEQKGVRPGNDILNQYLRIVDQSVMDADEQAFIKKFKDIHKGKRILVLATGASLKDVPLECLKNNITIGCNGIGHFYYPDYYVICDPFVYGLHKDVYNNCPNIRILSSFTDGEYDERIYYQYENLIGLSKDAIYSGDNTGFIMLSIAYIMGASEIYLVGFDGYSKKTDFHCYDDSGVEHERVNYEWEDFFSLQIQLFREAMRTAVQQIDRDGKTIKLVGDSSYLFDIVEKISLEDFINEIK